VTYHDTHYDYSHIKEMGINALQDRISLKIASYSLLCCDHPDEDKFREKLLKWIKVDRQRYIKWKLKG